MKMTFGYELELGDVPRWLGIPARLGAWEYAERDVVNIHPPYRFQACDPLGESPPVGGEINVVPAHSAAELTDRIGEILDLFRRHGATPTPSCVSHGHVHVRVPGLRDDIDLLKRLTKYIGEHQEQVFEETLDWHHHKDMNYRSGSLVRYLRFDGALPIPEWRVDNILHHATDFDSFIALHQHGKAGFETARGRPSRYGINMYCLKHIDTIEFRHFRATTDLTEIFDTIRWCGHFLKAALDDEPLRFDGYQFPRFHYNPEAIQGWWNTRWPPGRGKKERKFYEI